MNTITITRRDNGFVLSVDGGSIECGTTAEVMSRVGHEMGMPFNKAQRQLFERMEAAEKVTRDLEAENDALFRAKSDLEKENADAEILHRVWDEVNDLSDSINQGYVTEADLRRVLREEYDIEINWQRTMPKAVSLRIGGSGRPMSF